MVSQAGKDIIAGTAGGVAQVRLYQSRCMTFRADRKPLLSCMRLDSASRLMSRSLCAPSLWRFSRADTRADMSTRTTFSYLQVGQPFDLVKVVRPSVPLLGGQPGRTEAACAHRG